jgi:hypothetical protein
MPQPEAEAPELLAPEPAADTRAFRTFVII